MKNQENGWMEILIGGCCKTSSRLKGGICGNPALPGGGGVRGSPSVWRTALVWKTQPALTATDPEVPSSRRDS
ncbi:MAG: hypothetical protein II381_03940 [Victivallales bacterium]|nr:hypothetical protein [Victivallales bacterium]